ncbi:hypothetical protein EJ08DRAFT_717880, partial [Tothia fuscella]
MVPHGVIILSLLSFASSLRIKEFTMRRSLSVAALLSNFYLCVRDVAASPSEGCGKPGYNPTVDHYRKDHWEGREMSMIMPRRYHPKKPTPLVLVLPDRDQTAEDIILETMMSSPVVNDQAITLYAGPFEGGHWSSDATGNSKVDHRADIQYISDLLDMVSDHNCIDTSRIYVAGIGTGGGLAHLLACDPVLSRRIAAFVAVSGAFYTGEDKSSAWHECKIGRRPIPFMEIHGNLDEKWPYWPTKGDADTKGPQPQSPAHWLNGWRRRNNCGEKTGKPKAAHFSNGTIITELEHGRLSEGVEYAGGAVRVTYSCPAKKEDRVKDTDDEPRQDLRNMADLTLLHYSLKEENYGWPRKDLKKEEKIKVNDREVTPPGDAHFDATELMFRWFVAHPLPEREEIVRQAKELEAEPKEQKVKDEL